MMFSTTIHMSGMNLHDVFDHNTHIYMLFSTTIHMSGMNLEIFPVVVLDYAPSLIDYKI